MSSEPRCPVCGRSAGTAEPGLTCGQCGWLLHSPLWAGTVTADMRRDFDTRLRVARHDQAVRDAQVLDAALRGVLGDLRPGSVTTVVDINADEVTVMMAYLDAVGSPQVRESGSVAWTSVLWMLAAGKEVRHAQLADGIAALGDDGVASALRDRMPPVSDGRMLVVCRPADWRVLEAAAVALAAGPGARLLRLSSASGASVHRQLADLAATAPLRHTYRLMTAAVDSQTGAVALRPRELFAVGAGPGTEASLTLRRMPGDVSDTTLAIFADTDSSKGTDGAAVSPFALLSVPLPAGPTSRLRAVLEGPGKVRIVEPPGAVPYLGTWEQVRRQVPSRVTIAAEPVDLVCAIDLAGTRDIVQQRTGLVRGLLRLLAAEYPAGRRLRVGLVTCTDHVYQRGKEKLPVTRVHELGAVNEALNWLDTSTGADISYPPCAPVEDLLQEALTLLAGSRRAEHVPLLLTVVGRRPHPHAQQLDDRHPCPHGLMWQDLMLRLTRQAGTRCVVVADTLAGGSGQAEWQQIGPAKQRELATATARQAAEDLGVLTAQAERIPLPLTDEPEGVTR